MNWQPNSESTAPGEWGPAKAKPEVPGTQSESSWRQPGKGTSGQQVVRGQVSEPGPDATIALVKRVCEGRALSADVRWTGSKKLTVILRCNTAADAQRLINDISTQAQIVPLQIDFSVVLK